MSAFVSKKEMGNLITEGIPEIPVELSDRLDQYQSIREATVVDWLHNDGGMLIATRFGESTQFHLVKRRGGLRKQVTFFSEPIYKGSICPDTQVNGFLFAKDIGGNEAYQLYYFDLDTGRYRMLTDGKSRNDHGIWSKDGRKLLFSSTKANGIDHDIYLCDPFSKKEPVMVWKGHGYWYPIDWSPDGRFAIIAHFCSVSEHFLYSLDIESGGITNFDFNRPGAAFRGGIWNNKGSGIFFTSDENHDFNQLYYYQLDTGEKKCITRDINWDVELMSLSPDGTRLSFVVNENGLSQLYIYKIETDEIEKMPNLPLGVINALKWRPNGNYLGISINTPKAPSDVFVLDIRKKTTVRWTFSETGGLDTSAFVSPQLIHYNTFDQEGNKSRKIPAYFFKPPNKQKQYPVLIYIHGGPESQYRPEFSPIFQFYLNELGVAVLAPNVRGSTGYGKHFLKLDNGYKREDSVYDIGKLLDWIEKRPELDSTRVAVMGGSYGGYMVLASMTHFNQRLRCGIDIVGISNFVTFLENTQSYRRDLRRIEYGDERDPVMRRHLERISPTSNAHKITKPMLIVQGLNDPRVPVSEAEQMLRAIRKNGGEAWYLLAKDEGHGFRKKTNRDYYTKAVILFLQRFLLDDAQFLDE